MLLALFLLGSLILSVMFFVGYPTWVIHTDLGKFTYRKQRIVLGAINLLFTISMVISYLLKPSELWIQLEILFAQWIVPFIYIFVFSFLNSKQFYRRLANEIRRLNLDINEDLTVLKQQLMDNSDIAEKCQCSFSETDLRKAINLMNNDKKTD